MYLLPNTNNAGIKFFMTQHVIVLLIMDMASAKSNVNGRKTKLWFLLPKNPQKFFKNEYTQFIFDQTRVFIFLTTV